jgi:tetratricopeptide (TPR) repeat protein
MLASFAMSLISHDPFALLPSAHHLPKQPGLVLLLLLLGSMLLAACEPGDPIADIRAMHEAGQHQESLDPLRELMESRPDDPEVLFLYAAALTGSGLVTQAVWPLRRAMESTEWRTPAAIQLASLALITRDWDMAVDILGPLLEREPQNLQALLLRAYSRAQSRRDYEGALADAEAALTIDSRSSDALVLRAVALLGLERIEDAGDAIDTATAHFEEAGLGLIMESPRFCVVRATFSKEKKEMEAAEKLLEGCLEKYPENFLVVDESMKFFDAMGRSERSLEIIRSAYEAAPQFRSYRISLVHRLSMLGQHDEAEALMLEATLVDQPELAASAFADLAGYYFRQDNLDASLSAFDEALVRLPDPGPEFMFTFADALVAAGRYDRALALADRMTLAPHRDLVRGRVALARGDPDAALRHFSEGLKLWPDNAVARYFAAIAADQLGDFDRTIEEYRYSIRADASATDARLRLARLYMALGDDGAALEVIRHDAERQASGDLRNTLLELELLARLGRGQLLPPHIMSVIQPPDVWARAVAALAGGVRVRSGPAASARTVLMADRINLTASVNAPALSSLVEDLIALGRIDAALARVDAALRVSPKSSALHALKGSALVKSGGDVEAARAAFERAIEIDADNAVALRGLAALEAKHDDAEAALALYRRATSADPEDTVALQRSSDLLASQGRPGEAERDLEALLERDHYDGAAALQLAQLRLERDRGEDRKRTLVLLRRATRFGGGAEADRLLAALDSGAGPAAATQ